MNSVAELTIYSAGPLDLGNDLPGWRQALSGELESLGVRAVMFSPGAAYVCSSFGAGKVATSRSHYIEATNRWALETANVMVVSFPKGVQSVGTPIEIEFADLANVPIYIITDIEPGSSVYLDNRIPPGMFYKPTQESMARLAEALYELSIGLCDDGCEPGLEKAE
jgi:hypothetical protein